MNYKNLLLKLLATLSVSIFISSGASAGTVWLVSADTAATNHDTSVLVLLGQRDILVGDDQAVGGWSNVTSTPGAQLGIIGALINSSRESKQEKFQESLVAPIRSALSDMNGDDLALKATKIALQKVNWLNSQPVTSAKDDSRKIQSDFLDQIHGDQAVFIHYVYFFDPDFQALHAKILIEIAKKSTPMGGRPEDRFKTRYLACRQTIDISVPLTDVKKSNDVSNAKIWAANNGDLARKALISAFDSAAIYIPRMINMNASELSSLYDRKFPKMKYDGDWGQKIEDTDTRTVMWAERFVIIPKIGI